MVLIPEGSSKKQYPKSDFKEGKQKCPVCGKKSDWKCRVTEDGRFALCKFTPNESGKTDKFGRFYHILIPSSTKNWVSAKQTTNENITQTIKADDDRLDKIYCGLLENLDLEPIHFENLVNDRGLDFEQVCSNMYASVPQYDERFNIAQYLSEKFDLEGVPGFYFDGEAWVLHMTFQGFYIPYRNEKGQIVGLQIRRDEDAKNRYMWVSSKEKEKGASSGSPLHFVNVETIKESKVLFLTEGALKADIIGAIGKVGVVASAGVSAVNPEKLVESIFDVFPDLERIVVAYDMDWETNENVQSDLIKLLNTLKKEKVEVDVATWDVDFGKGLDDVLVNENYAEGMIRFIPAKEFQSALATAKFEKFFEENAIEFSPEISFVDELRWFN